MSGPEPHPALPDTLELLARIEYLRRELTAARAHVIWVAHQRGASVRQLAVLLEVSPSTVQNLHSQHEHWPRSAPYCQPEPHS